MLSTASPAMTEQQQTTGPRHMDVIKPTGNGDRPISFSKGEKTELPISTLHTLCDKSHHLHRLIRLIMTQTNHN